MSKQMPPGVDVDIDALSQGTSDSHEEIVDLFGRLVMWMRWRAVDGARMLVDSEEHRQQLAAILRDPYERVAKMAPEEREAALDFAEAAVDGFVQLLLRVLAHQGVDFPVGRDHAARYVLDLEVVDRISDAVVLRDTINRNGEKHFASYWGRWLNRFGKHNSGK